MPGLAVITDGPNREDLAVRSSGLVEAQSKNGSFHQCFVGQLELSHRCLGIGRPVLAARQTVCFRCIVTRIAAWHGGDGSPMNPLVSGRPWEPTTHPGGNSPSHLYSRTWKMMELCQLETSLAGKSLRIPRFCEVMWVMNAKHILY